MKALVHFKHKSMKEYWSDKNFTKSKVMIDFDEKYLENKEDIEKIADHKVMDIIELLYPVRNGSGYDTCYQYDIFKIDLNPYNNK